MKKTASPHPLAETSVEKKVVYQGPIFSVESHRVRLPDGHPAQRDFINFPKAVVVVPVTPDGRVYLVEQFRFATGEALWELPAGKNELNEDPLACARRELEEETGCRARYWQKIAEFYTSPGFSNEWMTLFVARDVKPVEKPIAGDEDERICAQPHRFTHIWHWLLTGRIRDAKTLVGLYAYKNILDQESSESFF